MRRSVFMTILILTAASVVIAQEGDQLAQTESGATEKVEQEIATTEPGVEKQSPPPGPENTLEACRDGEDNDRDDHIDCDDQDCSIYAMCVKGAQPDSDGAGAEQIAADKNKDEDRIIHRPFSVGFVPGLTTDGGSSGKVRNNFTLNFIGWGDYLTGAEFSLIGGIRKFDVRGFQGAGIFNYTNGDFRGFQASGIADVTRGSFLGVQGSGIASVSGGDFKGLQGAGIATVSGGAFVGVHGAGIATVSGDDVRGFSAAGIGNVAMGDHTGFQGAGIANVAAGSMTGFQGAGVANYAESVRGAQISGIANIAPGEVRGLQAGLINYGTRVHGAQIGLINIASKEMKGAPIGLINYAGDGILAPMIWGSDNSAVNLGLKMGSRYVYGILGWGIHPVPGEERDSLISGLGGHIEFDPVWLEIDIVTHWMHDKYDWGEDDVDMIHKFRPTVGFRVVDQLSVFAGPTLNLLVSEVRDDADLIPAFSSYSDDDLTVKLSLGFIAGLQWEPKWGALNTH